MDGLRYRSGTWICLVQDSVLCLLPPETSEDRIREIWTLLGTKPALDRVFAVVSGGLAGNLADMPSFGVLALGERCHVLLRGPLELQQSGQSEPAASGEFVTTWSERVLSGPGKFTLRITAPAVAGAPGAGMLLPLESGAALVSALEFGSQEDTVPATGSRVQPPAVQPAAADSEMPAAVAAAGGGQAPGPDARQRPVQPGVPRHSAAADQPAAADGPEAGPAGSRDTGPSEVALAGAEPLEAENPDLGETVRPPEEHEAPVEASHPEETLQPAPPVSPSRPLAGQLIDSVPWLRTPDAAAAGTAPAPSAPAPARPAPAQSSPAYPAPPVPAPPTQSVPSASVAVMDTALTETAAGPGNGDDADLDHDGDTIMSSELANAAPPPAPDGRPITAPTVLARTCPVGHANPPTRSVCALCGQPLGEDPQPVPRPALGRAVFSTGQVEPLDKNMVIGRQPSVARTPGSVMPRMVQVPSGGGDISRSHAEIRLEGWHVMLRDLNSTNGTVMVRDGQLPHRLGQGEAVIVLDGDVAELGDGVWVRFEGLA